MLIAENQRFNVYNEPFELLINHIVQATASEIGYLHLFNESTEEIQLAVWSERVMDQCQLIHASHYPLASAGVWADCVRQRQPVFHNNYNSQALPRGHFPVTNHMSLPVILDTRIVGIVGVGNRATAYTDDDAHLVHQIIESEWVQVTSAAQAVYSQHAHDELSLDSAIVLLQQMSQAFAKAFELYDPHTAIHLANVAYLCEKIADKMAIPQTIKIGLIMGAWLHDIGKLSTPSQILNKTSELLPEEEALMRYHAEAGGKIMADINSPWPIATMIAQHHERLDGSGYPSGLIGEMICLEARIIAVADTFDYTINDRQFRHSLGAEYAMETIKAGSDSEYDKYVVAAFLQCYQEDPTFGGRYQKQ
ncbi:HD domain-containing phosphohydrolase [Salinibius halmophilus]|uniref:HD domain-containing phosphohydrolase n=1 Tax=Salinibius halmophilus TaxID=1853216 RepID=UPI000E66866F|nr:HD domain-containing phosphohydrolase [Salinibius halmophilus]